MQGRARTSPVFDELRSIQRTHGYLPESELRSLAERLATADEGVWVHPLPPPPSFPIVPTWSDASRKRWLDGGLILVCDRYMASSVAYGEAFGLDGAWLADMQKFLPRPALTIMLDIAPETAAKRKSADRDKYERDLALLGRVRESYARQAASGRWTVLDGERSREAVASDVYDAARRILE